MRILRRTVATALTGLALAAMAGLTPASAASDYFSGKVIRLILPNSPSGEMARYAHMFAPYIAKYTGAKDCRVVVMKGGGGVKGANYLWFQKPDGLTIALTSIPALTLAQLAGSKAVQYDVTKFTYLGRIATEPRGLLVGTKSGIKTIDDLIGRKKPFVFPSQGTDEDFYTMAILASALHFNLKVVTGYNGQGDTAVAVIKGVGDGLMTATRTAGSMIKSGDMHPILSMWETRDPNYPNVPSALEVTHGKDKVAVQAIINMLSMHRNFFAPKGMDPAVTAELRDAVMKAAHDPALVAQAKKNGMVLLPEPGDVEQKKMDQIASATGQIVPVLKAAVAAQQ